MGITAGKEMGLRDERTKQGEWCSVSVSGSTALSCVRCGEEVDLLYPSVDHHPSVCPACGSDCIFISWKRHMVQIVPEYAPEPFSRLLRWCQENLDEFEFVTVLTSVDELADLIVGS